MKKWMKVGLASAAAASMLAACAKTSEPPAAEGTGNPNEKAKFSISMRTLAFNHVEKSPNINEDKWVKKLEELTNTDLNIVLVPHKEFEQKMIQMFATNDIPDVVQGSGGVAGKEMAGSVQAGDLDPAKAFEGCLAERDVSGQNLRGPRVPLQPFAPCDRDPQGSARQSGAAGAEDGRRILERAAEVQGAGSRTAVSGP
ncbi:hypothetical protein [Paenibacillus elgii]|uniref:hypothetical protein n=1 Tax=Paenibacillus elgii TaxID=189691 RepID=UPI002D7E4B40|nr:hypothetical protein [Paenibacillus elgii]